MVAKVDFSDVRRLARTLESYSDRAFPHGVRQGLNKAAFLSRGLYVARTEAAFTLRNSWTLRSLRFEQAPRGPVENMVARVGSVADYMAKQERGFSLSPRGEHGVPIPTSVAGGQARGTKPRRRPVRRPNRMRNINLPERKLAGMPRSQRTAVTVAMALRRGDRYVFLDLGDTRGIFRVRGTERKPRIDMVWSLDEPNVSVGATPVLEQTLALIEPKLPRVYERAIVEQLRRQGAAGF